MQPKLFLDQYDGKGAEVATAEAVKEYLNEMVQSDSATWLEDFWDSITILKTSKATYNDADAPLLLQMGTAQAIENAKLVMEKAIQYYTHIKW